jgi:hypothetical protein
LIRIALVTGIGAGVALSLANEGAAIAVNYASDREGVATGILSPEHNVGISR